MKNWQKWLLGLGAFLTALAGGTQIDNLGSQSGRGNYQERVMLNAVEANATSSPFNVADFQHIGVTISASSTSGTVKFGCSMSETAPTVSTTPNLTNRWDYVEIVDLQNGSTIDGDTGIAMVNVTDVRQFEINTNNLRWCAAFMSENTGGTTTVHMLPANNS